MFNVSMKLQKSFISFDVDRRSIKVRICSNTLSSGSAYGNIKEIISIVILLYLMIVHNEKDVKLPLTWLCN